MSLHDYERSRELGDSDEPFYGIIMAAMRRADSVNAAKLRAAWPEVWDELQARYNAPGGVLDADPPILRLRARLGDLEADTLVQLVREKPEPVTNDLIVDVQGAKRDDVMVALDRLRKWELAVPSEEMDYAWRATAVGVELWESL